MQNISIDHMSIKFMNNTLNFIKAQLNLNLFGQDHKIVGWVTFQIKTSWSFKAGFARLSVYLESFWSLKKEWENLD